jgi:hypothetical protein
MTRKPFQNLVVDHITTLCHPSFYPIMYIIDRVIFGVPKEGIIYHIPDPDTAKPDSRSLTYAASLGKLTRLSVFDQTLSARVQPGDPDVPSAHVWRMLEGKYSSRGVHTQHIAYRSKDVCTLVEHARSYGMNFVTPLCHEEDQNFIQIFTGEFYGPETEPGTFLEFVQREVDAEVLRRVEECNRETFFRDRAFMQIFQAKEDEEKTGIISPILDFELQALLNTKVVRGRQVPRFEDDLELAAEIMQQYADAKD